MINTIDIKIITAKDDVECKKFAAIALTNRLYISQYGWQLAHFLKLVKNFNHNCDISLAYIDDIPIGVSLLMHNMPNEVNNEISNQISVFVRKSYRKLGVGTKLVDSLKKKKTKVFAREGIHISKDFYKKQGIYMERVW